MLQTIQCKNTVGSLSRNIMKKGARTACRVSCHTHTHTTDSNGKAGKTFAIVAVLNRKLFHFL